MVGLLGEGVDYIGNGTDVQLFCQVNYGVMAKVFGIHIGKA